MPSLLVPDYLHPSRQGPGTKLVPKRVLGSKYGVISEASEDDKKAVIFRELGELSRVKVMSGRILVALYIAGNMFAGSKILRTDTNIKEDLWQGNVGLVVKMGGLAFRDDPATNTYFHGQTVTLGDWVTFRPGDGKRIQINGVDCRIIEDALIDMVVDDPTMITQFT